VDIDGQQINASWYALSDKPDTLAVGDVLYVGNMKGGMWLCVRDTTNLSFINHLDTEALLYRKVGEKIEPVGFSNSDFEPPRKTKGMNKADPNELTDEEQPPSPRLADLNAAMVTGLWGVHINWDENPAQALRYVQPLSTFCSIRHMTGTKRPKFSATFAFRYLSLKWTARHDDSLYALFSPGLIFLKLSLNGEASKAHLDAARLANASDLRLLDFSFPAFVNHPTLARLIQLRHLNLSYAEKITTAPWLSQMTKLRTVNFSRSGLAELSPFKALQRVQQIDLSGTPIKRLSDLKQLPELQSLSVEFTAVKELPLGGFVKLRSLQAFGSKLKAPSLAAFRTAHPQCTVQYEWKLSLLEVTKQTDRLVVRSGGTCHRNHTEEKILFETKSLEKIRELVESIDINEAESDSSCMCCGFPTLEFYQETKLLAMVGVQHGGALRWGPWPADGMLTANSSSSFNKWMTKHGIPSRESRQRNIPAE